MEHRLTEWNRSRVSEFWDDNDQRPIYKKAGAVHKVFARSKKRNAIQEYVYVLKNNVAVLIVWQTQRSK